MFRPIIAISVLALSACVVADDLSATRAQTGDSVVVVAEQSWLFADHADTLRAQSCSADEPFIRPSALTIDAQPITIGEDQSLSENITGMALVGAWHLTADDKNFGGLSGLAVMRSGSLLAISDAGAWISIGIDPETSAPDGYGSIGYMRNASGRLFGGKIDGDSEGLAVRDGLALVSFEQDHRIEAFDLEGCGVGARAARVTDLPPVIGQQKIPSNRGAEALGLMADGRLQVGFEMANMKGSPQAQVLANDALADITRLRQTGLYLLTDVDFTDMLSAHVFRAYDPIRGSRVQVSVSSLKDGERTAFADLKAPLLVDNFEGVAFAKGANGQDRLWLISDDNFSSRQRTLLLAFEID